MPAKVRLNEATWDTCEDLSEMWGRIRNRFSNRKQILFTVACLRRNLHLLQNDDSKAAVEVLERYADGKVGEEEWQEVQRRCQTAFDEAEIESDYKDNECLIEAVHLALSGDYGGAVYQSANASAWEMIPVYMLAGNEKHWDKALDAERAAQCGVLREILSNPFRAIKVKPAWRTEHVLTLAESIDRSGDDTAMPILGDALEEAGCAVSDLLEHCRGRRDHVRGCWAVDVLLGKS